MKIIWSPAVTFNGNLAKADVNSDRPTETDGYQLNELTKKCGCVIVGKDTFDHYKGEFIPVEGAVTLFWTRDSVDS